MAEEGEKRAADDRRKGDRRKAQMPFEGPDRRSGEDRRKGADRRAHGRVSGESTED